MVVQVAATDADDPTYGNSARVVYSIIHGQPYFSVEPKTGGYKQMPPTAPWVWVAAVPLTHPGPPTLRFSFSLIANTLNTTERLLLWLL